MAVRYLSSFALALLAACGEGHGYVQVLVTSDGRLGAVEKLHVTVDHQGQRGVADFPLAAVGAYALSTPQTFSLQFAPERRGEVTLTVEAISPVGKQLASATTTSTVAPGMVKEAAVHLDRIVTWKKQESGTTVDLVGIAGPKRGTVYAIGGYTGVILGTTDGGRAWRPLTPLPGVQISYNAIHSANGDTYAMSIYGIVARERAGVWSMLSTGNQGAHTSIWSNGPSLYAVGSTDTGGMMVMGMIVVSGDDGLTWKSQSVGKWQFRQISGCGDDEIYAVAFDGTIVQSTNRGATWLSQESHTKRLLTSVSCARKGTAVVVGEAGTVLRTADSGANWDALNAGTTNLLFDVWTHGPDIAYVVGDGGTILYTYDGGKSWKADASNSTVKLRSVWGSTPDDVYAVGEAGTILHLE